MCITCPAVCRHAGREATSFSSLCVMHIDNATEVRRIHPAPHQADVSR